MRNILNKVSLLHTAILFVILTTVVGCNKEQIAPEESIQNELDKAVESDFDGAILCVKWEDKTETYAAGYKDKNNLFPASSNDLFKIASISKLYIAVSCAKLISNGTLDQDRTLAEYLPDVANRIEHSHEITLRMLIQHRSGVPDFIDHPDYPWGDPIQDNYQTLEMAMDQSAEFKPDNRYKYSNTNYLLIGIILDKELGYSHHKYIREEILFPNGLYHTYSLLDEVDINDLMSGCYKDYDVDLKTVSHFAPGGSMIATAEDVAIFLSALNEGTLLNNSEQEIYSSLYEYEHTGLLPGYQSIARYHKDLNASVVLFVSRSGGNRWYKFEKVYKQIVKILKK
ncbi:MAG: serine hydrolase domain-containing protein [Crocinitomicaceae bacterium]|nr:beta-lactamase family protein [Crocinitomicaceae bacterium]